MTPEQQRAEADRIAAERRRLQNEIDSLHRDIERARQKQEELKRELEVLIAAIPPLAIAAGEMSTVVSRDISVLSSRLDDEEHDTELLIRELEELAERYLRYKNLATATKRARELTDAYFAKYGYCEELRHITLGCIMAVDREIISHDLARKKLEEAYAKSDIDYWLAYASSAIMLWWSDEREAAQRAMDRALLMDKRKSSLLFLFCTLKFGRLESAARWYAYYLSNVHANDVGPEYQYLLEAYLSGSFGDDAKLEQWVGTKLNDMLDEIGIYNVNFPQQVAETAERFIETKAHRTDFPFFYLAEYCPACADMRQALTEAEKNQLVARYYEGLALQQAKAADVEEHIEESIHNLISSMDPGEEKIFKEIRYNELIVAAKGDIAIAQEAYDERYFEDQIISFDELLKRWAFTEDDPRILPEARRFSTEHLVSDIKVGFKRFAEKYRALVKPRYPIQVGSWSYICNEDDGAEVDDQYTRYFDRQYGSSFLKDKFCLIWTAMIVIGIVVVVASAVAAPHPSLIVAGILSILAGGFLLWRQVASLRAELEQRKAKDLKLIHKILGEMGTWRTAYQAADDEYDLLLRALSAFGGADEEE